MDSTNEFMSPTSRARSTKRNCYPQLALWATSMSSASPTSSHPFIIRSAAAFGRYPINNLVGIHDVAGLAVDAV